MNAYLNHDSINAEKRDITFLWLNRVIPQRRYDWFIKVLAQPELGHTKNYIVGITPNSSYKNEQEYIIEEKKANLFPPKFQPKIKVRTTFKPFIRIKNISIDSGFA